MIWRKIPAMEVLRAGPGHFCIFGKQTRAVCIIYRAGCIVPRSLEEECFRACRLGVWFLFQTCVVSQTCFPFPSQWRGGIVRGRFCTIAERSVPSQGISGFFWTMTRGSSSSSRKSGSSFWSSFLSKKSPIRIPVLFLKNTLRLVVPRPTRSEAVASLGGLLHGDRQDSSATSSADKIPRPLPRPTRFLGPFLGRQDSCRPLPRPTRYSLADKILRS